jgi:SnoaL-like polyketide cyclase
MSVEENINLMRRWFKEVWNEGKTQTIHDLLAPDAVGIGELEDGVQLRGPAEFVPFAQRIRGAFPDINVAIEDAFGAGDRVGYYAGRPP